MKRKKILALLAVGALLAGTLTGCGGGDAASGETREAQETLREQQKVTAHRQTVEMTLRPLPLSITMRTVRTVTGVRRRLVRRSRRLPV